MNKGETLMGQQVLDPLERHDFMAKDYAKLRQHFIIFRQKFDLFR